MCIIQLFIHTFSNMYMYIIYYIILSDTLIHKYNSYIHYYLPIILHYTYYLLTFIYYCYTYLT